ncbi:hypothetical protein AMK21_04935 [Streptomyces sp. CB00316]|nr:hypothetical protein AMK21_04935 [Streptomyces sp. CB00316]
MVRAAMPEAAIHEYRDAIAGEHEVGSPPDVGDWPGVDPIAHAAAMEQAAEQQFWFGVLAAVAAH